MLTLSCFQNWQKRFFSEGLFLHASSPYACNPLLSPSPLWQYLHPRHLHHHHQRKRPDDLLLRLRCLQQLPFRHPDGKIGCLSPEHQMPLLDQTLLLNSAGSGEIFKNRQPSQLCGFMYWCLKCLRNWLFYKSRLPCLTLQSTFLTKKLRITNKKNCKSKRPCLTLQSTFIHLHNK